MNLIASRMLHPRNSDSDAHHTSAKNDFSVHHYCFPRTHSFSVFWALICLTHCAPSDEIGGLITSNERRDTASSLVRTAAMVRMNEKKRRSPSAIGAADGLLHLRTSAQEACAVYCLVPAM
jgi:hypothetical protein